MVRVLNSFKVRSGNRLLDFRLGGILNLDRIKMFFQEKEYKFKKFWSGSRHVLGILTKNDTEYFLKLSTSEGISIVTQNEYAWNDYFNKYFPKDLPYQVPKNFDSSFYQHKFFYLITDYFDGKLLCGIDEDANQLTSYIENIILLSELIQQMPKIKFSVNQYEDADLDFKQKFLDKVNKWFNDIPSDVRKKFEVETLLSIVEKGINELISRPRHGDFAPWHIIKLTDKRLGLIDGEHASLCGVESYDICYFIQRVFSVLKRPDIAKKIFSRLKEKGFKTNKLKTVLAARAIGGFLDESLANKPDYIYANNFKDWIKQLS